MYLTVGNIMCMIVVVVSITVIRTVVRTKDTTP